MVIDYVSIALLSHHSSAVIPSNAVPATGSVQVDTAGPSSMTGCNPCSQKLTLAFSELYQIKKITLHNFATNLPIFAQMCQTSAFWDTALNWKALLATST